MTNLPISGASLHYHNAAQPIFSEIACYWVQGYALADAIGSAKHYISEALRHAKDLKVGSGSGPVQPIISEIACYWVQGYALADAIGSAKHYISEALHHAKDLKVGSGSGPVQHFFGLQRHD